MDETVQAFLRQIATLCDMIAEGRIAADMVDWRATAVRARKAGCEHPLATTTSLDLAYPTEVSPTDVITVSGFVADQGSELLRDWGDRHNVVSHSDAARKLNQYMLERTGKKANYKGPDIGRWFNGHRRVPLWVQVAMGSDPKGK